MKDMRNQNKNKRDVKKESVSSVITGLTGAAIGFGIAVAGAAVVLNDKNNRKKVRGVLTNIKGQVMDYMKDVQRKTDKKEKEIEENGNLRNHSNHINSYVVGWIHSSHCREIYSCSANYCCSFILVAVYWGRILNMDDSQQKSQIDEEARKAKEGIDTDAFNARQLLADQESERIRSDAEAEIAQIQNDAQK